MHDTLNTLMGALSLALKILWSRLPLYRGCHQWMFSIETLHLHQTTRLDWTVLTTPTPHQHTTYLKVKDLLMSPSWGVSSWALPCSASSLAMP